eukprot:1161649-Pelagomonas_calceolata.AAC.3
MNAGECSSFKGLHGGGQELRGECTHGECVCVCERGTQQRRTSMLVRTANLLVPWRLVTTSVILTATVSFVSTKPQPTSSGCRCVLFASHSVHSVGTSLEAMEAAALWVLVEATVHQECLHMRAGGGMCLVGWMDTFALAWLSNDEEAFNAEKVASALPDSFLFAVVILNQSVCPFSPAGAAAPAPAYGATPGGYMGGYGAPPAADPYAAAAQAGVCCSLHALPTGRSAGGVLT